MPNYTEDEKTTGEECFFKNVNKVFQFGSLKLSLFFYVWIIEYEFISRQLLLTKDVAKQHSCNLGEKLLTQKN